MLQFFHGWRRKVGCVSLALALMFCSAWVRSTHSAELIKINSWMFKSGRGAFSYQIDHRTERAIYWRTTPIGQSSSVYDHFGSVIPYWCVTTPLTLLSAYLILWKTRKQKTADQPAISNLISN